MATRGYLHEAARALSGCKIVAQKAAYNLLEGYDAEDGRHY